MSNQTLRLLAVLLEDPTAEWYGFDLMERTGLKSGTLYPILFRLENAGWLASRSEDVEPTEVGRAPRRFYTLTGEGERAARLEVDSVGTALLRTGWKPKLGGSLT
jgi:PadR family transcriptional regulator PadR